MSGRTTSCWRGVPMPQMRTNKPQKTKSHEAQAHQQTALSNPGAHTLSPKPSTRSAKTLNPTRSNLETQHPRPSMHAETLYHTNSKTHHIDAAWCLETAKGFGRRTRLGRNQCAGGAAGWLVGCTAAGDDCLGRPAQVPRCTRHRTRRSRPACC